VLSWLGCSEMDRSSHWAADGSPMRCSGGDAPEAVAEGAGHMSYRDTPMPMLAVTVDRQAIFAPLQSGSARSKMPSSLAKLV